MPDFVHLHLHTLYSLLDGAIRMKDLIKTVKAKGMKSVAVTDHGNMFGAIDFYKKAKDAGMKPILGMEAYVAGRQGRGRTARSASADHLILLAKNEEGWANLRYLSSMAYTRGLLLRPAHRQAAAARSTRRGSSALTACLGGEVAARLPAAATWTAPAAAAREYKRHLRAGLLLPRGAVQRDAASRSR